MSRSLWACMGCRRIARAVVAALILCAASTQAERNVTVVAGDPSLSYQPAGAWRSVSGQPIGDGTAMLTGQTGASVTLQFMGTAIYFQTTRAPAAGISTVRLDGTPFELDSKSSGSNAGSGVVWGVVALRDEMHTLEILQSSNSGVQLTINAFVYTTDGENSTNGPSAGPLNPSSEHYVRNTALISAAAGLLAFICGILLFIWVRKQRTKRQEAAAIRLGHTPTSPSSLHKQFGQSVILSAASTEYSYSQKRTSDTASASHVHAIPTVHVDLNDPEAVRQARMLHPLVTGQQYLSASAGSPPSSAPDSSVGMLPQRARTSSTSSYPDSDPYMTQGRGQGQHVSLASVNPPTLPDLHRSLSNMRASSATSLPYATPSRSTSNSQAGPSRVSASSAQNAGRAQQDRNDNEDLEESKDALARRLREVASFASSSFPAGFAVIRAPSPPPAYVERGTTYFSRTGAPRQSTKGGSSESPVL